MNGFIVPRTVLKINLKKSKEVANKETSVISYQRKTSDNVLLLFFILIDFWRTLYKPEFYEFFKRCDLDVKFWSRN